MTICQPLILGKNSAEPVPIVRVADSAPDDNALAAYPSSEPERLPEKPLSPEGTRDNHWHMRDVSEIYEEIE